MRYILHKENDQWWICLEGPGEYVHNTYQHSILIQHELIMEFDWFDGEGSYVMDDDLIIIPEGADLRQIAESYPDREIKVRFKEEVCESIKRAHQEYLDKIFDSGYWPGSSGEE